MNKEKYIPVAVWCDLTIFLMCPDLRMFSRKFLDDIGKYTPEQVQNKKDLFRKFSSRLTYISAFSLTFDDMHMIFEIEELDMELEIKLNLNETINKFVLRDIITNSNIINWEFGDTK